MHFKEQLTLQSLGWKVEMSRKWQCIFERAVDPKKVPMKGKISPKGQLHITTWADTLDGGIEWFNFLSRESEVTSQDDEAQQLRFGLSLTTLAAPSHMNYIMYIFGNNEMFKQ